MLAPRVSPPKPFPDHRSPTSSREFIPPWIESPPESLATSRPPDCFQPGPTSLGFPAPFNGIPALAPFGAGHPSPLRFRSQVFSTSQRFPSKLGFHGLVSCRNRSWVSLLQSFPLAEIVYPSRGHLLPRSYPPALRPVSRKVLLTARFPDVHALDAVAWFPARLWVPFPLTFRRVSRSPWVQLGIRAFLSASPASEPCSPCESVHSDPGCPEPKADTLLVFRPPEDAP
jgi:hypothetical protein